MTVRGFLTWYLGTVATVSASGAVMWHDIQSRKHVDIAAIVAPPPTPAPVMNVTDVSPQSPAAEPIQAPLPKAASRRSQTASLPVPPLPAAQPATNATRVVSGSTRVAKPRLTAKSVPRTPMYQSPDVERYPGYASGYAAAYPPAIVAPWQMQPYPGYHPYRRYYVRYPYFSAY
jgi:hypothetical protein